jgi:hypothetical protein
MTSTGAWPDPAVWGRHVTDHPRGRFQVVPVRLPAEDHARLRAWSQRHGFTMATVIRGLLARFLDEHQPNLPEVR